MTVTTLLNYIGGRWTPAVGPSTLPVVDPATGTQLAQVPMSGADDVAAAVQAARAAFETWQFVPPVDRARVLFRFKALLDEHKDELAAIVTAEHGKTLGESAGDVRRGIENVEHACGIPTLMMGDALQDVARGIDCFTLRQPLGVFAVVAPFNFPAMVPLWFVPYAVATGNTVVLKPSEQCPMTQAKVVELAIEAGMPSGVLNLVHGGRDVVEALCDHPDIAGISFVGSTPVAKAVYQRASSQGKRVQALGGAKNHIIVTPDADLDQATSIATESVFGCTGQRCLAGSVVVAVGSAYEPLKERLVEAARRLVLGAGNDPRTTMGPLVSKAQRDKVVRCIEEAVAQGGRLLVDGRERSSVPEFPSGAFLGPTLVDGVTDEMTVAREEVFGPVMAIRHATDLQDAIAMVRRSRFANACSIVTSSGAAARTFRSRVGVSMLGVNVGIAAPMAFFPFGGLKDSFFGDIKAHGADSIRFFTDAKVVIERW